MPLRAQTRIACQRCRKKRAKCDGETPCERCKESNEDCIYDQIRRESKGELRAETARLRKDSADSDTLLRVIASIADPVMCKTVLQGLMDGTITRQEVLREYHSQHAESDSQSASTGHSPSASSSRPQLTRSISTSCFSQLASWRACRPNIQHVNPPIESDATTRETRSTILSLPPLPLDAYRTHGEPDRWTRTGWTKAHIRHLIDALRTWDYFPFCIFSEELFMRDYDSGCNQFCSSALVHAVLALSTRLINESSDDIGLLPSGWLRSRVFFDEASGMLQTVKQIDGLPDVQALGLLSLYLLRCGREVEAQHHAEKFVTSIGDLCRRYPDGEEEYIRARKVTYCGAVTLVRMLALTTGRLFNIPDLSDQEELFSPDSLPRGHSGAPAQGGQVPCNRAMDLRQLCDRLLTLSGLSADANSRPWNVQLITTSLFQLTEWVYQIVVASQADAQAVSGEVASVYAKCLDWYSDFFSLLPPNGGRTPFVLFVHMYYHFCLLCAFRPFVHLILDGTDLRPDEVCIQATQSILALGQSYDDLFTLRRVSGLTPYFICASGLFSLGMEEGGSHIDEIHLRPGDEASFTVSTNTNDRESFAAHTGTHAAPSHVKMSAAAHARLLLAKISSTHPAAAVADKLLRRETGLGSGSQGEQSVYSASPMDAST